MTPEALKLRAENNLAALPSKERESVSWLVNAGVDDTKSTIASFTGTARDIRILEVAYDHETAIGQRTTRIKLIIAALKRFGREPGQVLTGDGSGTTLPEVVGSEVMLSGSEATTASPMQIAAASTALEAVETGWQEARRLADLAKNFSRATTAAKTLCGIQLRSIREYYFGPRNPQGGRPKKTPNDLGFSSWREMLADKVGITDECATNWMKMAAAVEGMAEAQGLDLQTVCKKLPWEWTAEETAAVDATVQKLTEDKTQRELLQSDFLSGLGYEAPERINSSNNPHGKNGGSKKKPAKNEKELLRERQEAARLLIFGTANVGKVGHGSVAMFMETVLNNGGSEIEALPQVELRDLYEVTIKPFAALMRKLAAR